MTTDHIQPGDVFVKPWGRRQIVHVFLPPRRNSNKQYYMRLHSGNIDSTWVENRSGMTDEYAYSGGYCFVGTVPQWFLQQLMEQAGAIGRVH